MRDPHDFFSCRHMVGKEASQAEQPQRVVAPWNPELQITVVAIFIVKMVQSAVYLGSSLFEALWSSAAWAISSIWESSNHSFSLESFLMIMPESI